MNERLVRLRLTSASSSASFPPFQNSIGELVHPALEDSSSPKRGSTWSRGPPPRGEAPPGLPGPAGRAAYPGASLTLEDPSSTSSPPAPCRARGIVLRGRGRDFRSFPEATMQALGKPDAHRGGEIRDVDTLNWRRLPGWRPASCPGHLPPPAPTLPVHRIVFNFPESCSRAWCGSALARVHAGRDARSSGRPRHRAWSTVTSCRVSAGISSAPSEAGDCPATRYPWEASIALLFSPGRSGSESHHPAGPWWLGGEASGRPPPRHRRGLGLRGDGTWARVPASGRRTEALGDHLAETGVHRPSGSGDFPQLNCAASWGTTMMPRPRTSRRQDFQSPRRSSPPAGHVGLLVAGGCRLGLIPNVEPGEGATSPSQDDPGGPGWPLPLTCRNNATRSYEVYLQVRLLLPQASRMHRGHSSGPPARTGGEEGACPSLSASSPRGLQGGREKTSTGLGTSWCILEEAKAQEASDVHLERRWSSAAFLGACGCA